MNNKSIISELTLETAQQWIKVLLEREARRTEEFDRLNSQLDKIKRVGNCGSVTNWLELSEEQLRDWFAITLDRDSQQCKRIQELEYRLEQYKFALNEWLDKTEWVQQQCRGVALGKHRADVMTELIKGK